MKWTPSEMVQGWAAWERHVEGARGETARAEWERPAEKLGKRSGKAPSELGQEREEAEAWEEERNRGVEPGEFGAEWHDEGWRRRRRRH